LSTKELELGERAPRGEWWLRYAAPQAFFPLAGRLIPYFGTLAVVFAAAGLYLGFFVAPTDFQQGEAYRIIFLHVPAAWMSMFLYVVMALWGALGFVLNTRLSGMMASAIAPTGAMFTFLALWFLYVGFIALKASIDDPRRADRAGAVLALVGVVNVPIIYFSVQWWNTLHQGASVSLTKSPSMATTMLWGMLLMALAAWMYSIAVCLARVRLIIREREQEMAWMRELGG
jgi:heme exporter protein C